MKTFSYFVVCVATAMMCAPAFPQSGEQNARSSDTYCSLSASTPAFRVHKPMLLPAQANNTNILLIEDKNNTPMRFTWNLTANGSDASVACFRGRLIAPQIMPPDARCLLSVRKKTTPKRDLPASDAEKLICE
jgi:hypothetical protein